MDNIMRIIHLSDLHFGTEMPALVEALTQHVRETPADLLIVSGDLTQIASHAEFKQARAFLDSLGLPIFCVPGNHDIPRYDILERMCAPYRRYRRYINPNIQPTLETPQACIAGMNTARRILPHWNWAHGAIAERQLKELQKIYQDTQAPVRICVMHHPIHKIADGNFRTIVYGGTRALEAFGEMKIDLVLTGHVHHAATTLVEYDNHHTMFLSASTALSRRLRKSANGYNVITIEGQSLHIEMHSFQDSAFRLLHAVTHSINRITL